MRIINRKLLLIVLAIGTLAVQGIGQSTLGSREWQKNWVSVQAGKWMCKTEISNADFRLFMNDLAQQGNWDGYHMYHPDTTVWKQATAGNSPYVSYYYSHPSFNNYPLVGISHEAAVAYCQWLTYRYAQQKDQPFGNVEFRLPTHDEWKAAAQGKLKDNPVYPWGTGFLVNNRGQRLGNFVYRNNTAVAPNPDGTDEKTFITAPVNSHFSNSIGIYNMSGNVAEMIAEAGIAAGGSYLDGAAGVTISSTKTYDTPTSDVGFRIIMVKK